MDGVYSADPRIISTAKHIPVMSLDSAWELSLSGAKVLSAAALEYARKHSIALCANSTSNLTGKGTFIRPEAKESSLPVVSSDAKLVWLKTNDPGVLEPFSHALRPEPVLEHS